MAVLRRTVFFLCFVAVFSRFVTAQEAGETRVIKRNGEFQISQIIVFPAVPDALYYTLEFEKFEEGVFVPVDALTADETRVEVFLGSGSYRYRITSYNRMGLAEGLSDWQEFQVLAAVQPEVENYQPFYGLYYDIAKPDGTITVTGLNFFPESEFALVKHRRNFDWSGIELSVRRDVLRPDSVTVVDGGRAELLFNRKTLRKDMYDVFVRNPGGLWASLGRVQTGFRKGNDFTVSFGYAPLIAAFDYQNSRYRYMSPALLNELYYASYAGYLGNDRSLNSFMGRSMRQKVDLFNPAGAYIRTAWLPVKTKIGLFGLEGEVDFLGDNEWRMTNDGPGSFFSYVSAAYANLLYQYPLTDRWQLNARAGAGGGANYHYEKSPNDKFVDALMQNMFGYDYSNLRDVSDDSWGLLLNFGFSAQFFAWKNLFFEAGINFQYMLSVYHFMIRPSVGIGWQTGRWAESAEVKSAIKRGEDPSVPVTDKIKDEYTLSAGWAPMVPYYGINRTEGAHMDYADSFAFIPNGYGGSYMVYQQAPLYETYRPPMTVLRPFNPGGFYLRAAYIPYRWNKDRLGLEFNLYFLEHLNREEWAEDYSEVSIMSAGFFDILYQRILTESLRLNVRAGIGISNPYDIGEDNGDLEIPFAINTGISVQYFFWRSLYAEAGLDFTTSFGKKIHGIFRPTLGVGWQFGKNAETGLR
ncbi:MAG: hypothetical protein LBK08_04760 [Treponema sp.]|jgi:hypothetical protein|nr:hypothetical protein [Treponema sp.]